MGPEAEEQLFGACKLHVAVPMQQAANSSAVCKGLHSSCDDASGNPSGSALPLTKPEQTAHVWLLALRRCRHKMGIVHRDLKSPNLLVEATWKVKVAGAHL